MRLFPRRRPGLPEPVRAALPLEPGERALAWASVAPPVGVGDVRYAVATDRALLAPTGSGWERIGWHQVRAAVWDDEQERLVVDALTDEGPRVLRLALTDPTLLPETVRERVQASIVVSQHVPLRGPAGVRLTARRVPGRDELEWQRSFDRGLDPSDPALQERVEAALAELRRQTTA